MERDKFRKKMSSGKEGGRMNPASIMKIMNMKNEFNRQHPKFTAFTKAVFAKGIQEGSVIEISVKNPGEEEMASNIKVQAGDLELLREIKELME